MSEICVYCGANPGVDPSFAQAAREVGRGIATAGHGLVYGGGRVGLMGILADSALEAGGSVTGFIPRALAEREVAHRGLTDLQVTDSMHARKAGMVERSDGFIALPGGFGTLDEVLEVLTWNQIGFIAKPVVFLNINSFFDGLFAFFHTAVTAGLLMPEHRAMAQLAETVEGAITLATSQAPDSPSKWTDSFVTP